MIGTSDPAFWVGLPIGK